LEKIMKSVFRLAATSAILACFVQFAMADTYDANWNVTAAQLWSNTADWVADPGNTGSQGYPNAEGDVALFQVTSINGTTAQTVNRTVNLNNDITQEIDVTLGQLNFNLNVAGNTSREIINQGPGATKLVMDGAGSANAQLNYSNAVISGSSQTGIADINAPMQLNDQLQLSINNTDGRNDHLNLRIRSLVNGSGGITRLGPVGTLLIWPTPNTGGGLQYTGPTYLGDPGGSVLGTYGVGGGGRNQFVPTAGAGTLFSTPTASSSFHVVGNAQLGMSNSGSFQFGAASATLYFNSDGTGNAGGLGALRPERTTTGPTQIVITNQTVELDGTNTIVHSEGQAANGTDPSLGWIQFTGTIAGGGSSKLTLTTPNPSANHGTYALSGANTFSGGIDLYSGRLSTDVISDGGTFVSSNVTTHPSATFGTGDIHVFSNTTGGNGIARVTIPSGVANAIGNSATLTMDAGGGAITELGDGIDDVIGKLVLGGATQLSGVTYGSSTSNAMFQNNTYFTGNGMVQVGALGDFNGNGVVDAADYVVWRKSYESNTALYDLWRANFGNAAPGSGSGGGLVSSSVPEPSTFVLLALAVAPLMTNRRRRFAQVE
jgi:hypothetical protein